MALQYCGCNVIVTIVGSPSNYHLGTAIAYCPMHAAAGDTLAALEAVLTVQPRPVKIPGTDMNLTVSYTEGDLLKMDEARLVAAAVRGEPIDDAAPRNDD